MNNKLNTYGPKILVIILIISLLVISISILSDYQEQVYSKPFEQTNTNNQNNNEDNSSNENIVPALIPYYTTYPKLPKESETFLFEQEIKGYGDIIIKNIHKSNDYIYIIVETSSEFGDLSTDIKTLALIQCDSLGTINKTFCIEYEEDISYISSQMTTEGIILIGQTFNNILAFTIDYNLYEKGIKKLPYAQSGKVFTTIESYIVLLKQEGSNVVYQPCNNEMNLGFLPQGDIIDIYDFYTYYLIFVNTATGYNVVKLSSALKTIEIIEIKNKYLLDIIPIVEENTQKYIAIEKDEVSTMIWKYTNSFSKNSSQSAVLGDADNISLFPSDNNKVIATLSGEINGIYLIDYELNLTLANIEIFDNVERIIDTIQYANGFYILCIQDKQLTIIDSRNDNTTSTKYISKFFENAFFVLNQNGTICLFFNSLENDFSKVDIIGYSY